MSPSRWRHVATLFVLGVKSHRFGVVSPRSGYMSWAFYALIFKRSYLFYLLKSRIWYAVGKFFRSLNLIFYLLYKSSRNPHQAQKQCFNFELPINSSRCSLVQIARNEFQCQTIVHDLAFKEPSKEQFELHVESLSSCFICCWPILLFSFDECFASIMHH